MFPIRPWSRYGGKNGQAGNADDLGIDVIVDPHNMLRIMKSVEAPHICCNSYLIKE